MVPWKLAPSFLVLFLPLISCASVPPSVPLSPELDGRWVYSGGEPADDPLLSWKDWPDRTLQIDASRGRWTVISGTEPPGRTVLPAVSIVTAVKGSVLTLTPQARGRPFQVYWRVREGRLEFWWGDHEDWLKPHVVYRRPASPQP